MVNLLDSGPDMLLRTDAALNLDDRNALTAFAHRHDLPRISCAEAGAIPETICLLRPPVTAMSGVAVRPPPGAFLQATAEGEAAIIAAVLQGLPGRIMNKTRVAELYSGCGYADLCPRPSRAGCRIRGRCRLGRGIETSD